ncbi:hotdog fold thioesterase [Actinoplanes sp. TFC3]|uniref:hotdog fold thioesterase n=1 Tax=Actinoplanes sp. TFC3 TaxID=1710355 RepID=UPI00082A6A52|nr:hotdog fold thioesterase [Actinoplanes sp. TFC3]
MTDVQTPPGDLLSVLPGYEQEQLIARLGIEILEYGPQRVAGRMPVAGNRQPIGLLHGGASAALAETLGSLSAYVLAGPGGTAVGQELSCTHHRAVRSGFVTGVSTPVHEGAAAATYEIVLTDDAGRRVCTARLTCAVRKPGARRR